jgi:hypothetical protein
VAVRDDLVDLWGAFWELSTDRAIGFGVGPIPFTAIDRLASRAGIIDDAFDDFLDLMRAMDDIFLAEADRKLKQKG